MDRLRHAQKMATEQTHHYSLRHQQQQPTPETAPPPPYTAAGQEEDYDYDYDSDSSAAQVPSDSEEAVPFNLTINAEHTIRGSNNLIPTSPSTLQDATRFSTLLLAAVNQINKASTSTAGKSTRALKVDLTIYCGVTVVGDRNVVGNVALRPRMPGQGAMAGPGAMGGANVVAGAKRKAGDGGDEGCAKRVAGVGRM